MSKVDMNKQEKEWRAQDDLRTLKAAEEIKSDSDRMAAAKKIFEKEKQALEKAGANLKFTADKPSKLMS